MNGIIRVMLAITTIENFEVHQMDAKIVFLIGDLSEGYICNN
jgi:hypothetical protein